MYRISMKGIIVGILLIICGISSVPVVHIVQAGVIWDATIQCRSSGGFGDYVTFGEASDARDGPPADAYDMVKPPAGVTPYIRVWLNDNLPSPYDVLFADYRHYPATSKVWNLTVQWMPSSGSSPTTVTMSWLTTEVDDSEYTSVNLCAESGTVLKNMLTSTTYTFSCPAYVPQNFKIICSGSVNQPPKQPATPTGPTTRLVGQSGKYFVYTTDPNADKVQYRFDWNASGSHQYSTWTTLVNSGQTVNKTYTWTHPGTYVIKAQARDEHGAVSSWSNGFTVTISETLDQQQIKYNKTFNLYMSRWGGQSFRPTVNKLSRVQLFMRKVGTPPSNVVFSVRSSLTGANLVSLSKPASQIPTSIGWVVFDFSDLTVTPGTTYYLVLRTTGGSSTNCYYWGYGISTPFTKGVLWYSTTSGSTWTQYSTYDFCFKTYGFR